MQCFHLPCKTSARTTIRPALVPLRTRKKQKPHHCYRRLRREFLLLLSGCAAAICRHRVRLEETIKKSKTTLRPNNNTLENAAVRVGYKYGRIDRSSISIFNAFPSSLRRSHRSCTAATQASRRCIPRTATAIRPRMSPWRETCK